MKYFELLILSIPSFGVCYLMICLVNAKKRILKWKNQKNKEVE